MLFNNAVAAEFFYVNDERDLSDLYPLGDTSCAATLVGTCTLRAAIEQANAMLGLQTIIVNPENYEVARGFEIADSVVISGDPRFHQQEPTEAVKISVQRSERRDFHVLFNVSGATRLGAEFYSVSGSSNTSFETASDSEIALVGVDLVNVSGFSSQETTRDPDDRTRTRIENSGSIPITRLHVCRQ